MLGCLAAFGFPDLGLTVDDLLRAGQIVQLGRPPNRIDLLTSISGVEFDEAWANHVELEISGLAVPVIGRADLRRKLAELRRAPRSRHGSSRRVSPFSISSEGAGQVVMAGPPNSGKSSLLDAMNFLL